MQAFLGATHWGYNAHWAGLFRLPDHEAVNTSTE
jgi:hypothetical protein